MCNYSLPGRQETFNQVYLIYYSKPSNSPGFPGLFSSKGLGIFQVHKKKSRLTLSKYSGYYYIVI